MKNKTKIAFVQKIWEDNPGVLSISAVLKENGYSSQVFIEQKQTYRDLLEYSPDIIGYSCMTGEQKWVFSSVKKVKELGLQSLIILGGPHATFFPTVLENPLIDAICVGEGEHAMLELAKRIEDGKTYHDVKNFHFKQNGTIIKNELRPLISDLDSIPFPDRSYYEDNKFLSSNPFKIFITGRGCPFKCTFCFNHVLQELYGNTSRYIRRRSVDNVMKELIDVIEKWGIDQVRFSDDHFALDIAWLREFSIAYRKLIAKPYTINARADILNEERIVLLKESGCRLVCFGVETGNEDARNNILNKKISDKQIIQSATLLKKYGIRFLTSNIIGLPNETPEDAWKTIEINQKIGTDLPWYSMMQYYPGTLIYQNACKAGLIGHEYDVDKMGSYFENDYLQQDHMDELKNIHSFSIIVTWIKPLTPLAKILAKKIAPNIFFKIIFKLSYSILTLKRANFSFLRILKGLKYYLKSV